MEKPSFAVTYDKEGKATLLCMSANADEVLQAFKAHDGRATAYIRPVASKSKGEASGLVFREDKPATESAPELVETPELDSEEETDEDPAAEAEGEAPKRRGRPPKVH